jgi:hypothetical protein
MTEWGIQAGELNGYVESSGAHFSLAACPIGKALAEILAPRVEP